MLHVPTSSQFLLRYRNINQIKDSERPSKCVSDNQPFYLCELLEFFYLNLKNLLLKEIGIIITLEIFEN